MSAFGTAPVWVVPGGHQSLDRLHMDGIVADDMDFTDKFRISASPVEEGILATLDWVAAQRVGKAAIPVLA